MERSVDCARPASRVEGRARRRNCAQDCYDQRRERDRHSTRAWICAHEAGGCVRPAANRFGGLAVCATTLVVLTAQPLNRLAAQSDSRLAEALRVAQSGQGDSGRAIVRRLLARLPPSDSVYPEALLTAAKIAPDAQTVAMNLNRIVVDYGSSPWADDALLLLTQLYYAQHDAAQTIQAAERLNRDYPDSPLRARANFSAARAYFEQKNETRGCELIQQSLDGSGDDVEFKNQVSFYAARCSSATTTATTPPPGGDTAAKTAGAPRAYPLQVPAGKSAAQAG